ncbi:hypothetical protein HOC13_02830 [Candidatus Woesearchaeota archaeon]|jgi:hypothetical protein|nr:hypothetical protein [Candidatus Woesearchaeota archaeon]
MPVIRVNLNKVGAEKVPEAKVGQISIENNVSLRGVEPMKFEKEGKKGLLFDFSFVCNYKPELGNIDVEGHVVFVEEAKLIDEIQESWKKDKRVPTTVMEQIMNAALHKGHVQAIKVAEDVGLPSPLRLPQVSSAPKKKK